MFTFTDYFIQEKIMGTNLDKPSTIKSFDPANRPREKMAAKGKSALSDSELIAILIGSGSVEDNAITLAKKILDSVNGDLSELGRRSLKDLQAFKGIGEAKAITIAAALEIGRRRQFSDARLRVQIITSRDIYEAVAQDLIDLSHEEFHVLFLNRANHIIGRENLSKGGTHGTVVDAKFIFKYAVQALATSIILCHNHPSGNLNPSQADIDLTRKLRQAGSFLDITILDHVIVAKTGYYSFADDGRLS